MIHMYNPQIIVLVWSFDKVDCTACSSASQKYFYDVNNDVSNGLFQFNKSCPNGEVSLPFFFGETFRDDIFHNKEARQLKQSYSFPAFSEKYWVDCLRISLIKKGYEVMIPDTTPQSVRFCRFTGGGDLMIIKPYSPPLVFLSNAVTDEPLSNTDSGELSNADTGGFLSNAVPDVSNIDQKNLSPVSHGTAKLSSISIEARKRIFHSKNYCISYGRICFVPL